MKSGDGASKSDNLSSQVLDLPALLDYQDGAVVSKTVIDKEAGTLTLFAFDEGEGLSEHTAPYDALVQVLEGEAEVVISGQPFLLTQGRAIIMPAHEPHALRAVRKFKMLLIMIRS